MKYSKSISQQRFKSMICIFKCLKHQVKTKKSYIIKSYISSIFDHHDTYVPNPSSARV